MIYDFDKVYDRRKYFSSKWAVKEVFGREDIIPMWVADMDFPVAQPILDAIFERAEHPIFGYTMIPPGVYESIIERLDRKFGWKVEKEWIMITPGVMPAVNAGAVSYTHLDVYKRQAYKCSGVLFGFSSVRRHNCKICRCTRPDVSRQR